MLYLAKQEMQLFLIKLNQLNTIAALTKTGTIRGISKGKLYKELGFEAMKEMRWFRRLCGFYKSLNNYTPAYLYTLLYPPNWHYNTRNYSKIRQIFCRT